MEKGLSQIAKIICAVTLSMALCVLSTGCKSTRQASKTQNGYRPSVDLPASVSLLHGDEKLLVDEALTWLGTPYRYGGQDYKGTDCSGLTMKVYLKALGIAIPRNSREQQKFCDKIHRNSLTAGDLVFFCTGSDKTRVSHVGLYIGDGRFIHSSARKGVIISNMEERYYSSAYHSSGHVAGKKNSRIKTGKNNRVKDKEKSTPTPVKKLETEPLRFELNEVIESKIDSIYSSFLD